LTKLAVLHAFTGCDTVSSFSGKGKSKAVKLLLKESAYIDLFSSFGNKPSLSESQHQERSATVCLSSVWTQRRKHRYCSIQVVLCEARKIGSKVSTAMLG